MVDFDLKTASKLGVARVKVIATSGKLVSEYDVEMDVRASNPPVTTFISGGAESGKNWETDFTLPGMEGTNSAILEVSAILPMDAGRRLKYLIQYPYGCIEQTTSTAFAQLYLDDVMELNDKFKTAIDDHIKYGIKRISTFQLSDGSFSYWPGQQLLRQLGNLLCRSFPHRGRKQGICSSSRFEIIMDKSTETTCTPMEACAP